MSFIDESWRRIEPDIRRHWEQRHRSIGERWSDVRNAYRFGWEAALRPEFAHHSWAEAKEDLAQHWYEPEEPSDETSWQEMQGYIEEGWRLARRSCRPDSIVET
jgi:hypothetical protein